MVATNKTIRHVPKDKMTEQVNSSDDSFMVWYGRQDYRPDQVLAKKEIIKVVKVRVYVGMLNVVERIKNVLGKTN